MDSQIKIQLEAYRAYADWLEKGIAVEELFETAGIAMPAGIAVVGIRKNGDDQPVTESAVVSPSTDEGDKPKYPCEVCGKALVGRRHKSNKCKTCRKEEAEKNS